MSKKRKSRTGIGGIHNPNRVAESPIERSNNSLRPRSQSPVRSMDKPVLKRAGPIQKSQAPSARRNSRLAAIADIEGAMSSIRSARTETQHREAHERASQIITQNNPDAARVGTLRVSVPLKRVDPIGSKPSKNKRGVVEEGVSPSSWGSLGAKPLPVREAHPLPQAKRGVPDKVRPSTSAKHDSSTPLRDGPTCKPRPQPKAGMGTSREFIPWCDVKKR